MSRDEVIDILLNEMECVQRASDDECNRDCAKCDLLRDTDEILQAYRISIKALEHPEENVVAIVPCGDCISRAEVLDLIDSKDPDYKVRHFKEDVECLPSVTLQQKTGRWIHNKCDKCGASRPPLFDNFCPNCGAKMQEVEE